MKPAGDPLALVRRAAVLGQAAATTGLDSLVGNLGSVLFASPKPPSPAPIPHQGEIPEDAVAVYRAALERLGLDEVRTKGVNEWVARRLKAYGYHWQAKNYGALRCLLVHEHGSDGTCLACYGASRDQVVYLRCYASDEQALDRLLAVARAATLARPVAPLCHACGAHDAVPTARALALRGGGYDCARPTYGDGASYPPPAGAPIRTAPPPELRRGGYCDPAARAAATLLREKLCARPELGVVATAVERVEQGSARIVVVVKEQTPGVSAAVPDHVVLPGFEPQFNVRVPVRIENASKYTGPPGLIPILPGPGYVTPDEAIRRGATRYPDGTWNLTTVTDRSHGGLGGPMLSAFGAVFVALLVAGGAATVEAYRLVRALGERRIAVIAPGEEPPPGWAIEANPTAVKEAFVAVFGTMLGGRLYERAVAKGWRYVRGPDDAAPAEQLAGIVDNATMAWDLCSFCRRVGAVIGGTDATVGAATLITAADADLVAYLQQQNPRRSGHEIDALVKRMRGFNLTLAMPGEEERARGFVVNPDVNPDARRILWIPGTGLPGVPRGVEYYALGTAKLFAVLPPNPADAVQGAPASAPAAVAETQSELGATGDEGSIGGASHDPADAVVRLDEVPGYRARRRRSELGYGFWRGGKGQDHLPDPADYVDPSWDPAERERVAIYLDGGLEVGRLRGGSWCRLCQDPSSMANGNRDMTDGTYVYPDGLAHYVREHGVRVPADMEARALGNVDGEGADELATVGLGGEVDLQGYRSLREHHEVPDPPVDGPPLEDGLGNVGADIKGAATYHPAADLILDVRSPDEYAARHLVGSVNVPVEDLGGRLDELRDLAAGRRIAVFCTGGLRAARAVYLLRNAGLNACSGHKDPSCGCVPLDGASGASVAGVDLVSDVGGAPAAGAPAVGHPAERALALEHKAQELVAGWSLLEEKLGDARLDGALRVALLAYYERWRAWWDRWLKGKADHLGDVGSAVDTLNAAAAAVGAFTSPAQVTRIAGLHARAKVHNAAVQEGKEKTGDEPELVEYTARWEAFVREINELGQDATAVFSWVTDSDIELAEGHLNLLIDEWNKALPYKIAARKRQQQVEILEKGVREIKEKEKAGTPVVPLPPGQKPTEIRVPDVMPDLPKSAATQAPGAPPPPPPKPETSGAKWLAIGGATALAALAALKVGIKVAL